jgi:hypothetical chaperone protein
MPPRRAIGLDFGTTNSALALAESGRAPRLVHFATPAEPTPVFRSLLYFHREETSPAGAAVEVLAGPRAIERYLQAEEPGRLIQSLKTFLAARDFASTVVLGTAWRLEALIGRLLGALREEADAGDGLAGPIVVGRPVHFVNASDAEDEAFALARLRAACRNAGFGDVRFEYEPVAAAADYARRLERAENVLVADFGGGTSDFCLLRLAPPAGPGAHPRARILGTDGVPVAGDAFDARIVRHRVTPQLGNGDAYRTLFGRVLRVPAWIYGHVERWHHLSFLKSPKTMQILLDLRREALDPRGLDALIRLVEGDLGFHLYQAVERAKLELSSQERTVLRLRHPEVEIEAELRRAEFEAWIRPELDSLATCVDALLQRARVAVPAVDRVFMTGGSSFVPAVRRIFAERFGEERLAFGGELTSVASGLAAHALVLADGDPG